MKSVLISGAGIAGPALAFWLKAAGYEPTIVERAPALRSGGYVMNDNAEPDFLDFIRDPTNGFLSVTLPLKGGTELCVKVA